ncbi:AglZ/HisF2 family acetamidino modification protein [Paremcibacter congregatus]|uniref:Imidazole glycerol phosphate synthase subunit HisF n=1 Tax=Paremcibacter congregatus TaxID=2043170 RepID=A0A2G4YTQ9_9PROT|nr:AglZ/HisF2 family acetamidino modification protein [Paremcibacter congregatus]PHZ84846.1 imidazole glycerol phosphate synthase subunit HisF [Paremcibacter congregatus]QDE26181.1 imidazole glycerol phosphate synthase subunit HisF [Paremcibacter congregatus]
MLQTRVMPCLLLDEGRLVKTTQFKKPRYVGDPINAVRIYNEKEVDEIIILDITASEKNKSINFELLEQITSECFIPVTYGGGVKSVDDFKKLYKIGIEKVSINSAAIKDASLIPKAVNIFGSQSVMVTMDIKRRLISKKYSVYKSRGKKALKISPIEYAKKVQDLGAGELMINFIESEGTWSGFDIDILSQITQAINIPVIAVGGAGNNQHIQEAVIKGGASAIAIGSIAVFQGKDLGVLIRFPKQKELEYLFHVKDNE